MAWRLSLLASAMVVACAICAPAKAEASDQPGGDVQVEILQGGSPDAVYSNLGTFQNVSFAPGGATQQVLNTMTRMAADDLNLVGTPPYSINGFRFIVTNLNAVDVSARPLVRFYLPNGPGGGPGTLIESRTYNPTVFHAGVVGTIKTSSQFVLNVSHIWAGIAFDNNAGTTGATAAQLDNLALGIFSPPEVGTSADQYFVTTAAAFNPNDTTGALLTFSGSPPANFGWEMLTAQDVDLSITMSDGVTTAFPGGNVVYTITASNAGPDPVFDARVVDTFPASLTCSWTCAGSAGNTCAVSGSGNINDATVGLAAGGSVTYTATCAVSPAATGTLVNTAAIFAPGTAVEANVANNSATDIDTLTAGPPTITKAFGTLAIVVPGTTTLTVTLSNPNAGTALSGVGFADTLPAGLVVTTPNGLANACGGTVTAVAGTGSIGLVNGGLAAGGSCTITVSVTGSTGGLKSNTTSAVTSTEGGTGGTAVAYLVVVQAPTPAPPTIAKAFGAASIVLNGTTTLAVTLNNPNTGTALSGVGFTDPLPAGLVVATPNGLVGSCGGGTVTAVAGTGSVALANGSLVASGSCTITVNVTGTTGGTKNNTTGAVTSTEGGTGGTASAGLLVILPPAIAKAFGAASIVVNGTTSLTITLTNPNAATALTGLGFADTLPAGLVVATPNGLANTCGGTATAVAGTGSIGLASGSLPGGGSCTITVNVTGTTRGAKNNSTGGVTSTEGGTGGTASAGLLVIAPPTIAKVFGAPSIIVNGTTTLKVTLTNPNTATALTGVSFTDTLPAGLVVATPNGLANTCNGTVTAVAGTGSIGLVNGGLVGSGSCTVTVNVTGLAGGLKGNITSAVTSTEGGTGGTASASLLVIAPPTIAKAFGTLAIVVPGTTPLTFTLSNPNAGTTLTSVGFSDTLPAGLTVANGVVSPTCGTGTLTTSNPSTIALTGGTIAPSGTCTFSVTVTGTTGGLKGNTTTAVTSSEGGTGGTAVAFLVVVQAPTVAPPTIAKAFGAASIVVNGTTPLTVTLTNPNPGTGLTGVGFTDTLPAGLVVADPNGLANTCGGSVTADAGTGSVALANGSVAASGSCTVTVKVTGATGGSNVNTTGPVTSTQGGTGGTASASLLVIAPPTIAKAFGAASLVVNGTTALTVTLTNPNAATALTGVGFTDTLPGGLVVANPNGLANTCGGTVTADAGAGSVALANGGLPASGFCTITVTVTGTAGGVKNNTTSAVTSTEGGTGGTASAILRVLRPPTIAKTFGAASVGLNLVTTLTFTLSNPNAGTELTGVGFDDTLPAGLVVAIPNGLAGLCDGGTITAIAGTTTLALAGATLAPGTSCTFTIDVLAVAMGDQVNTTSAVTSANGGTGNAATASITVGADAAPVAVPTLSTFALAILAIVLLLGALRRQPAG